MEEVREMFLSAYINVLVVYCNMQMRLLSPKSLFFPIKELLEISDLVARRCKAESGICFKNRLKRGEVTHEKSGGNTGWVRGP